MDKNTIGYNDLCEAVGRGLDGRGRNEGNKNPALRRGYLSTNPLTASRIFDT